MTGESRIYRKSTGRQGIILRDKGIVLRRESFNFVIEEALGYEFQSFFHVWLVE